jgi:hypothetical protein
MTRDLKKGINLLWRILEGELFGWVWGFQIHKGPLSGRDRIL